LAKQKQNTPPKKETRYNRILKQFTAINNSLPEEGKISLKQRRQIIKQFILPKFAKVPDYKLRVKGLKVAILEEYNKLPSKPAEACNLNFIDPSNYKKPVEFFEIDEFFEKIMPDCIYAKVSAGQYGETNIFNTRDYNYGRKGVQQITEKIRQGVQGKSGYAFYVGYQKLRPNKTNNGQSDSYYLDMVLMLNGQPQSLTNTTKYNLPKTRQVSTTKRKVQTLLDEKFKLLKKEKSSRKNARVQIQKSIAKLKDTRKKLKRNPSDRAKETNRNALATLVAKIEKYYAQGKITKEKYDRLISEL